MESLGNGLKFSCGERIRPVANASGSGALVYAWAICELGRRVRTMRLIQQDI
jgi:hypothetical protein